MFLQFSIKGIKQAGWKLHLSLKTVKQGLFPCSINQTARTRQWNSAAFIKTKLNPVIIDRRRQSKTTGQSIFVISSSPRKSPFRPLDDSFASLPGETRMGNYVCDITCYRLLPLIPVWTVTSFSGKYRSPKEIWRASQEIRRLSYYFQLLYRAPENIYLQKPRQNCFYSIDKLRVI